MKTFGYNGVPLRQILMLNLSSEQMIVLLNFFSHKADWTIGSKGISERNFYREKNQKRINAIIKKLKDMGYIYETETQYVINLDKIQADFIKNSDEVTKGNPVRKIENQVIGLKDSHTNGVTQSKLLGVTQSNPQRLTQSNPNNNNKNGQSTAQNAGDIPNNKTKSSELDLECVSHIPSAASPSGQPSGSLHTPKVEEKVIRDYHDPRVEVQSIPMNDLKFLLDNDDVFRSAYQYNTYNERIWCNVDLSSFSNLDIAKVVISKIKDEQQNLPKGIVNLCLFLVRFSKKYNSNLWQTFVDEVRKKYSEAQTLKIINELI